jgi:hypothetical protein
MYLELTQGKILRTKKIGTAKHFIRIIQPVHDSQTTDVDSNSRLKKAG